MSNMPVSNSARGGPGAIIPATAENIRAQRSAFHIVPIGPQSAGYKIVPNPRQDNWFQRLFHRLGAEERRANYQSWSKAIEILYQGEKGNHIRPSLGALKYYHANVHQQHGKIDLTPASLAGLERTVGELRSGNRRTVNFIKKIITEQCKTTLEGALRFFCRSGRVEIPSRVQRRLIQNAVRKATDAVHGNITSRMIIVDAKRILAADIQKEFFPAGGRDILLV